MLNYSQLCAPIHEELEQVEKGLAQLLTSDDAFLAENVSRILVAGGKRFRPALLLTSARLSAGTSERAIKVAMAIELIHTATLIHDDVIDGHETRRGISTLLARRGGAMSILTGDYLYSKAFEMLAEDGDIDVVRCVATAARQLARGELAQSLNQGSIEMTEERYLSVVADKTASLISCACRLGARIGGSADATADSLEAYGRNIGMAFQITDDILDFTGEEATLGKPIGSDLREGKLTLPVIHTLRSADSGNRAWIESVLKSKMVDNTATQRIRSLVDLHKGIEYSVRKAQEYVDASKRALAVLGASEVWTALSLFADYSASRIS